MANACDGLLRLRRNKPSQNTYPLVQWRCAAKPDKSGVEENFGEAEIFLHPTSYQTNL